MPKFKNINKFVCVIIFMLAICVSIITGCATYKFQRGRAPYNKGYVVSRDDYVIPEYTIGQDNSAPNRDLAKERFKARQNIVEHYYKKMGYIENHFKMAIWDPVTMFAKLIGGIFRLPFIAISDYREEHNPQYRARVRKIEEDKEAKEESRIKKLKDKLNSIIRKGSTKENQL